MNTYTTTIWAESSITGELTEYVGPNVPGISFSDAQTYCENNGLGYCKVSGQLVEEIPVVNGKPDWKNKTDFETHTLN